MRGQEEAPIELLIGVTILTFVIIIGLYTYNNMCATQFEQKMKTSLSNFARNIELAYKGSLGTTIPVKLDFSPIGCMRGDVESVRMAKGIPDLCTAVTGYADCLVLAVRIRDKTLEEEALVVEVLSMPTGIVVRYVNDGCRLSPTSSDYYDLAELESYTDWSGMEKCGWELRHYDLKVTKTARGIDIIES